MERFKRILYKLLFPGTAVVLLSIPALTGSMVYVFGFGHDSEWIAYPLYIVSAYALMILCAQVVQLLRSGIRARFYRNRYIRRYLTDIPFKVRVSLYLSLGVNLLYAAMNFGSGFYYRSVWSGTLATYYVFLSVVRFLLLRYVSRQGVGSHRAAEWRCYRLCGVILLPMNMALAGVVVLVLHESAAFEYAGMLIYMMALYAFCATITSIVNVFRYRKYDSPVLSASKVVNLAAALVSMLALETAMLTQFDGGENSGDFRQVMIGTTGAAVCAIVVGLAVYMIARASRQLKHIKNNNSETSV